MIIIQDVLVSEDIVKEEFVCNLNSCKGACCWEGDFGAPVDDIEIKSINDSLNDLAPFLPAESIDLLEKDGPFSAYNDGKFIGTSLHKNGRCVFLSTNANGIAQCSLEQAASLGAISASKPLSCHLYPIRVTRNPEQNFEAWNYDKWDICSEACTLGKKTKTPVYQFLKKAIVRAKGKDFFDELHAAALHLRTQ